MAPVWPWENRKKPLILVVDDDPSLAAFFIELLDGEGYEVLYVTNGRECLQTAESKGPQLILLDMIMPEMGGLDALRYLKVNPKTKGIPVIMVTGEQKGKEVEDAFALGAFSYVIKPARMDILLSKVRQALGEAVK